MPNASLTIDGTEVLKKENGEIYLNNTNFVPTNPFTFRNRIINGDMRISQRGTSFDHTDTYGLDRWRISSSNETMTVSQISFAAGQTDVPNSEYFQRVVVSTTGQNAGITQRIEGVEQVNNKTFTLSFYARGGAAGGNIPSAFRTYYNMNFGSGGSTAINVIESKSHTLTSSWVKYTHTVTFSGSNTTSGKTIGSSNYVEVFFQQTAAETCDFDIAQVQLEEGTVATPFEHRPYGLELSLCQRYYQKISADLDMQMVRFVTNDTLRRATVNLVVTMRASPSALITSNSGNGTFSVASQTVEAVRCSCTASSSGSVPRIYEIIADAEL